MSIGEKIKHFRIRAGINQAELAELLSVKNGAISSWERNRTTPPIEDIKKMTYIFKVRINDLIGNDWFGADTQISKITNDFLIKYNRLTDDRKSNVEAFVANQLEEQKFKEMSKIKELPQVTEVALSGIVSAGTGEYNEEGLRGLTANFLGNLPKKYSFAALVNGDSMEPMFHDKEVIFVDEAKEAVNGQIVIAQYDGEFFIKKFIQDLTGAWLVSLNPAYKKMPINDEHPLKIYGTVL